MHLTRLCLNSFPRIYFRCFQRLPMICNAGCQNLIFTRRSHVIHHANVLHRNRYIIRKFSNEPNREIASGDEISSNFNEFIERWRITIKRVNSTAFISSEDKVELLEMFHYFKPVLPDVGLTTYEQVLQSVSHLSKRDELTSVVSIMGYLCQCLDKPLPQMTVDHEHSLQVFSDASNKHIGGYWDDNWFSKPVQLREISPDYDNQVFDRYTNRTIVRELTAVLECARLWGDQWKKQHVLFHSDNISVVWSVQGLISTSKIPNDFRTLLANLEETAERCNFTYSMKWLRGKSIDMIGADALSRGQVTRFKALHPQAKEKPSAYEDEIEIYSEKQLPVRTWQNYTKAKSLMLSKAVPCDDGVKITGRFLDQNFVGRGRDEHEALFDIYKKAVAVVFDVKHEYETMHSVNACNTLSHVLQRQNMSNVDYFCTQSGVNEWTCEITTATLQKFIGKGDSEESARQDAAERVLRFLYNIKLVEVGNESIVDERDIQYRVEPNGTIIASTIYKSRRFRAIGKSEREARTSLIAILQALRYEMDRQKEDQMMMSRKPEIERVSFSPQDPQASMSTPQGPAEPVPTPQSPAEPVLTPQSPQEPVSTAQGPAESVVTAQGPAEPVLTTLEEEMPMTRYSPPRTLSSEEQALYEKAEKLKSDGKSCVMILRLLYGSSVSYGKVHEENNVYKCSVTVNGIVYEGLSSRKNRARINAAQRALLESLNFQM